ncbi:MAG TPA: prepilin-type N-terminal cleavage/methylation domain-containing protein [Polyangiaceae bacterium]|nr:prepilin-type N-terminal cleavage/methylation domain-containing protein [Polyangiaceae bacterium]
MAHEPNVSETNLANARNLRYFQDALLSSPRAVQPSSRGFTLVELLATVTITGILAVLAVVAFRRHMLSAHSGEAVSVMQAIRGAQEAYRAENHVYIDVSTASGGTAWFPLQTPSQKTTAFSPALHPTHADSTRWQLLGPAVNEKVMFGYLVNAGVPGTLIPALQDMVTPPQFPKAQPLDWYLIQARGDVNSNGVFSRYVATSMSSELYVEGEGE